MISCVAPDDTGAKLVAKLWTSTPTSAKALLPKYEVVGESGTSLGIDFAVPKADARKMPHVTGFGATWWSGRVRFVDVYFRPGTTTKQALAELGFSGITPGSVEYDRSPQEAKEMNASGNYSEYCEWQAFQSLKGFKLQGLKKATYYFNEKSPGKLTFDRGRPTD